MGDSWGTVGGKGGGTGRGDSWVGQLDRRLGGTGGGDRGTGGGTGGGDRWRGQVGETGGETGGTIGGETDRVTAEGKGVGGKGRRGSWGTGRRTGGGQLGEKVGGGGGGQVGGQVGEDGREDRWRIGEGDRWGIGGLGGPPFPSHFRQNIHITESTNPQEIVPLAREVNGHRFHQSPRPSVCL